MSNEQYELTDEPRLCENCGEVAYLVKETQQCVACQSAGAQEL